MRALTPYHVPPAAGLIKLDAMENPYGWPPALVDAWLEVLRGAALNRYPDPEAAAVKQALRPALTVPEGMTMVLGNGSDELIQMINLAVAAPGRTVLGMEPSFSMYRIIAAAAGLNFATVPLDGDFDIDLPATLAAIERHRPAVIYLDYPNNPSGNLFDADKLRAVIEAAPGLVVLDEAYYPYAGVTLTALLDEYAHVVVLRTLSKLGLAGLRLGVMMGPPAWLEQFEKLRLPYNVNVLTQASAVFALAHHGVIDEQVRTIRADRGRLLERLRALPGIVVYPSYANFILFRVARGTAARVFEGIKARGVLIRRFSDDHGALADCLRVTVGTAQENDAFMAALQAALHA